MTRTATDKMIALMRRLKMETNGAVSEAMNKHGQDGYGVNYGVSVPTIKDIVCEVVGTDPDHELAALLWRQDVRELKLAALFVEDPQLVSTAQMQLWSADWMTMELAEQSTMQLFWQASGAVELAREWLGTDTGEYRRLAAYYIIGKHARERELMGELLKDEKVFDERTQERSAAYALREIYRHNENMREHVMSILERISPEVAEGVRWQVEYLPE